MWRQGWRQRRTTRTLETVPVPNHKQTTETLQQQHCMHAHAHKDKHQSSTICSIHTCASLAWEGKNSTALAVCHLSAVPSEIKVT